MPAESEGKERLGGGWLAIAFGYWFGVDRPLIMYEGLQPERGKVGKQEITACIFSFKSILSDYRI